MRTRSIGIDEIPDRARNINDIFINPCSLLIVHHNQVLTFPTLAFFLTIFKLLNNDNLDEKTKRMLTELVTELNDLVKKLEDYYREISSRPRVRRQDDTCSSLSQLLMKLASIKSKTKIIISKNEKKTSNMNSKKLQTFCIEAYRINQ